VPQGKIAMGKLAGSLAYGAHVVQIDGSFDDGLRLVREVSDKTPIALVNSVNPARLEGQKTGSFEICDALGAAPDWHCLPVGNAGNISAYWLGYREYMADGTISRAPRVLGAQAAGSAPILLNQVVEQPDTVATAIRIGHPARWCQALQALRESSGQIWSVTDDEIVEAYRQVARSEGVFCEPSSAAGLAGLRKSVAFGKMECEGKTFVAVLTGHGLKDPDTAISGAPSPETIAPTYDALMRLISE
jgi:threonine synthase